MNKLMSMLAIGAVSSALLACSQSEQASAPEASQTASLAGVTEATILQPGGEWPSIGRTYDEQRHSPLNAINTDNVANMGLAWYADLPTKRGVEATPLMVNGKLFLSLPWGQAMAFDAKTGETLWHFDPQVDKAYSRYACCDVVNRGMALWGNNAYVGSIDGRLHAIDQNTGKTVWEVDTKIANHTYTITGAPRVVNGLVIIGNGGAEMGARGYVTAYDAATGEQKWRFFTVPGNPADGFESPALEMAAKTWNGEWWKHGGGGTAWDAFAFDPETDLLYIGVGNGSTWNQKIRSPEGGDNLFVSSIVAVKADTGEYVWHYQTTPGDHWDYTATQHLILADMEVKGEQRKIIMQAPKNGFFYVLDRVTGELLSADNYMPITWATHVDMETGRPVENPLARASSADFQVVPGPSGAHNWHPMTYNPDTGLTYIPAMANSALYIDDHRITDRKVVWNIHYNAEAVVFLPDEVPFEQRAPIADMVAKAYLIARDPKTNKEVWRIPQGFYSSGGLLSTAGNLLFQGDLDGAFRAYNATTGDELWNYPTQGGIMAAPMTYELDGEQYVAVAQGWGGESGLPFGVISGPKNMFNISRLMVFKVDAKGELPVIPSREEVLADVDLPHGTAESVAEGKLLYGQYCVFCHGGNAVSAGLIPDLRYGLANTYAAWEVIVHKGGLGANGMPGWEDFMSLEETMAIRDYVRHETKLGAERGEKRIVRAN
ncbi:MAG TPA: PQQ-dependent dehydrogenase, methanol/ethanol family [Pseudomonadales bacterium]|nr:PQQ-dependent dehydrogenase, methanol/ethanol family [Pseudomonadales bacterium]